MHMRLEEFDMFKKNWDVQEKIKFNKLQEEKDKLKQMINPKQKKNESRLMEKVKQELINSPVMSSLSSFRGNDEEPQNETKRAIKSKLEQQTKQYEKILVQLEGDIRQHIRVEQQLKLHIEQMQGNSEELAKDIKQKTKQIEQLTEQLNEKQEIIMKQKSKYEKQISSMKALFQTKETELHQRIMGLEGSL